MNILFLWWMDVWNWRQRSWPALRWRHNERDSVSNHQPHDYLFNRLFRHRSKKTSKLRVTGLCAWNSPGTGEFPAQMASYADNVSIWWRHHVFVVVNFDALAQASDIQIERRQVVFLCWMQDLNPGSQTPNRQQTECSLTNRLSYRGSS